jgi:hypothetical protein
VFMVFGASRQPVSRDIEYIKRIIVTIGFTVSARLNHNIGKT